MPKRQITAWLTRNAPRAGLVLALGACIVVGWRLALLWPEIAPLLLRGPILTAILILSIVYAASLFLLGATWAQLVNPPRKRDIPALIRAYGVSSIAKYLPGNVFHLAGRQLIAGRLGISHGTLALATILEIALSIISALLVATSFLLAAGGSSIIPFAAWQIWIPALAAAAIIALAFGAGLGRLRQGDTRTGTASLPGARAILVGALLSAIFFFVSGLVAIACGYTITGTLQHTAAIAGAAIFAWLVGFVTPGVSGGLGVREATLLVLITPVIGEAQAMSLAIMIRGITTIGDILFTGACQFLTKKGNGETAMETEDSNL
jgi:hypothetical protein